MKKCIVIGAGFAGLSTAVYLSNKNIITTILEASPKPGGRAYSFLAKDGKTIIDNGQHILMGCYKETLRFMNMIDASENLIYQSNLEISFLQNGGKQLKLKAASLPYPLNLLFGILNYKAIRLTDRLRIIKFFLKLFTYSDDQLNSMTVEDWLQKENQNLSINKALWEIIAIGALNTSVSKASAKVFSDILKEMFLNGKFASTIILPKYGLSETYCNRAEAFIESRGGKIKSSHPVNGFKIEDQRITEVHTNGGIISDIDYVVSAIPLYSLEKIIPVSYLDKIPELKYSSILTVHIWLMDNPLSENFYGLINSPLHWIFNKKTHLTLVISDADYLMEQSKDEIYSKVSIELKRFAGITENQITDFQVIKEKRATFIPSESINNLRPSVRTGLDNLFVAGDWTDTGLPSTIESAVKSGRMAAEAILSTVV